jgi:hypothetical protein
MRAQRSWPLLLGALGIACATGQALDSSGNPLDYDGNFGGPDSAQPAGGGGANTGGYANTGGSTNTGGGSHSGGAASGGRNSNGGGQATTGGANQGGSGGTLPETGGRASTGGRSPAGGGGPTGGAMPTGGAAPTGGASSTGGASTDAGSCGNGQKMCGGLCVAPAPSNGCGVTGCTKCPGSPPSGGVLACDNNAHACDFVCLSGYTKQGNQCVSSTGGGGSSGAGGAPPTCQASACPKCLFGACNGCCASPTSCGCPAFCIPGTCN